MMRPMASLICSDARVDSHDRAYWNETDEILFFQQVHGMMGNAGNDHTGKASRPARLWTLGAIAAVTVTQRNPT